jgi:aldose 1-epimerase
MRTSVVLQGFGSSVTIEPHFGGRLSSWKVGERELLWQPEGKMPGASHPFGWGSFVMAPYAGRIPYGQLEFESCNYELPVAMAPHAIHGTVYDVPWAVDAVYETADSAVCELSVALVAPWPFAGRVQHRISLACSDDGRNGALSQQLTLVATETMPATMGWHPWFPRFLEGADSPIEWSFNRTGVQMFMRDPKGATTAALVPVPDAPWDDCFLGVGDVSVRWPGVIELVIRHDCPVVVLFDGLEHAVCVEPQTGPPNAPSLWPDRCVVMAGDTLVADTAWEWSVLTPI